MTRAAILRRALPTAVGAALVCLSLGGRAAVPVEDSSQAAPGHRSTESYSQQESYGQQGGYGQQNAGGSGTGGGNLSDLFYQLQVLQQDVQDLRGQLEEQGHRLDRLAKDQQEQYLDLDRRMQALRGGASGGAGSGSNAAGGSAAGAPGAGEPGEDYAPSGSSGGGASGGGERDAYSSAFQLMKQRQFDEAIQAFDQLVTNYPNGAYTPNAFYWLGELYLAKNELEKARQYFAQVVNLYPDHQKVPDALYKLGVVYHQLGDDERARDYLSKVQKQYPQSSAAGLAQTYLSEL